MLNEEIESYYQDSSALDIKGLNKKAIQLITEIFNSASVSPLPKERHLFASGITPHGPVNYLDTIFGYLDKKYIITGEAGTGKSTILEKIYRIAIYLGYDVEVYHCAFIPNKIEHMLIPQLGVGIITSIDVHHYEGNKTKDIVINTSDYVNFDSLKKLKGDIQEAKERYNAAFNLGVSYIARAKSARDELESYYVPNMDFDKVKACYKEILERILNYT